MAYNTPTIPSRLCQQEQALFTDRQEYLSSWQQCTYSGIDMTTELAGAINHWSALSLWNQAYLSSKLEGKEVRKMMFNHNHDHLYTLLSLAAAV